jgi:uncharacterized protein YycO
MYLYAYKGKSIISRLIRFQTRSVYSHIAFELDDGLTVEAWNKGGVSRSENYATLHTKGTEVDVFKVDTKYNKEKVKCFVDAQIGQKYDFKAIGRFLTRRNHRVNDKWFCSELAFAALVAGGLPLLKRIPASHVSPRDLVLSPYLRYIKTVVC